MAQAILSIRKNRMSFPPLIKQCFDAIHSGADHINLWGTGTPSREFLYVEDCARAIVMATQHYDQPEPINIGAGSESVSGRWPS